MRVLGMISGTSHDGIDVAVVRFERSGSELRGVVEHTAGTPYPVELRARLAAALPPAPTTLAEICELDTLIGQRFADAAAAAVTAVAEVGPPDLIVSHGQTVFHWVDGGHALGTLQIGQPAWIAERTGIPVLSDVRIRDITAGGHGAPLVSMLDTLLLAGLPGPAAALNLGGIANMTVVDGTGDPGAVTAHDIGPANTLVDAVVATDDPDGPGYDADGALAAAGTVDDELLAQLLADPYFALPPPKSTGKEWFNGAYVTAALHRLGRTPATADLVATLTRFTVDSVARDVRASGVRTLLVSGGGCRNPVLLQGLRAALDGTRVLLTDEFGAPADEKEAIAFALVGWCSWHGLPGALPAATGARGPRVLGTLTPGAGPLRLPEPMEAPPATLRLTVGS
ncbi:anhydro-N-acetylmuramic acid kinase [Nakamurella flavida]